MELLRGAGRLQGQIYLLRGQRGSFTGHLNSKGHVVVDLCLGVVICFKIFEESILACPAKVGKAGTSATTSLHPIFIHLQPSFGFKKQL
jgi:hypothetical protein